MQRDMKTYVESPSCRGFLSFVALGKLDGRY